MNETEFDEQQEEMKKTYRWRETHIHRSNNRVFRFIDQESYIELGEKLMKILGLVSREEFYHLDNYALKDILERIKEIEIRPTKEIEVERQDVASIIHQKRYDVLKQRLIFIFIESTYGEFEDKLRYFNATSHGTMLNELNNLYLDMVDVHHRHFFPKMHRLDLLIIAVT